MPRILLAPRLLKVLRNDSLTATQLSARTGVPASTITGALHRLRKKGLVEQIGMDGCAYLWQKIEPTTGQ